MAPQAQLLLASLSSAVAAPDLIYILLDDFGWANAGWHREAGDREVQTPRMDELVKEGVELDRFYAFKYCSPTRSAIQSGRNPIHVNVLNIPYQIHNPLDKVSGFSEMPRNMTGLAEHLTEVGYETHLYGKWHAGLATKEQTPMGRGYQKSLCYLGGMNDYWTSAGTPCFSPLPRKLVDLWEDDGPARGLANPSNCSQEAQEGCIFEDQLFLDRVQKALRERSSKPLFLFWSPHIVHTPLQVPAETLEKFAFIDDERRRNYQAMVYWIDAAIGNVTDMLKSAGTWNNTLVIVHSDNGGAIYEGGRAGGNNFPLKGGKRSNWEGGLRVNAFFTGGLLPSAVRGTKQQGLMAAWDMFATVAALAGVEDIEDHRGAAAGLPPVDSMNMWPLISGQASTSPREELAIGDTASTIPHMPARTKMGGLLRGRYKILVGELESSGWTGPRFPNSSGWDPSKSWETCGRTVDTGCLFDVLSDAGEHVNLAFQKQATFHSMLARVDELEKTVFSPFRGLPDPRACSIGEELYGGFWGPFVDVQSHEQEAVLV